MDKGGNNNRPINNAEESKKARMILLADGISATFRMVIPTIGLFLCGLVIDALLSQKAFYAIIGAVLGFLLAAYLIYRQSKKIAARSDARNLPKEDKK